MSYSFSLIVIFFCISVPDQKEQTPRSLSLLHFPKQNRKETRKISAMFSPKHQSLLLPWKTLQLKNHTERNSRTSGMSSRKRLPKESRWKGTFEQKESSRISDKCYRRASKQRQLLQWCHHQVDRKRIRSTSEMFYPRKFRREKDQKWVVLNLYHSSKIRFNI